MKPLGKRMVSANILCVGPTGKPFTGQSIATEAWLERSKHQIVAINNNFEGLGLWKRLSRSIALPVRVLRESKFSQPEAMYLSIKRSILGALVDLVCLTMFRVISSGPVVVHLHGSDLKQARRTRLGNALFKLLWKSVTDVIILSPRMADQLEGLPPRRVHVVRNFSARMGKPEVVAQKAENTLSGEIRVLYLSNIIYTKGFSFLTEAVRKLLDDGVEISLSLAGKPLGDDVMDVNQVSELLNSSIGDGITYLGVLAGEEKWKELEAAHVVALPTFYTSEAQPISLIEGMAFGAIPLTTHHNYNDDFLEENVAIFVAPQNAEEIADALKALISDRISASQRILRSAEFARDHHKVAIYVNAIDRVVETAIGAIAKENDNYKIGSRRRDPKQ